MAETYEREGNLVVARLWQDSIEVNYENKVNYSFGSDCRSNRFLRLVFQSDADR